MSNYPPGVTGNELEIAGPDWEGETERACTSRGEVELEVLSCEDLATLRRWAARDITETITTYDLRRLVGGIITTLLPKCDWEGEVEAWSYGGTLHWTCPLCGYEQEEDQNDT